MVEFAELDQDRASRNVGLEDTVLIVVKIAVSHREVDAFCPNSRAVVIRNGCARKLDILDYSIVAVDHPNPLTLSAGISGIEVRPAVHATQRQVVGPDDANVAPVEPAVDLNHITRLRGGYGRTGCREGFVWADLERRRLHATDSERARDEHAC